METHPIYYTDGCIYPSLFHRVLRKDEYTYKGAKKVEVEREYVVGLKWNVKHERILPTKSFLKDVTRLTFVCTHDIDEYLRKKKERYRD